ncbi:hypothetical protein BC829DRAFT_412989 [Chytridium lagenaria]|nr:hypothetical protein BC829DRAFT_412989 [Chytridium lagenaria]
MATCSQALENHPDKNPTKVEEATALFAEIRNAYEVLSDPNERAWYDSHRESILRGEDEGDFNVEDEETQGRYFSSGRGTSTDQLLRFFSAGVYTDYSESPSGFFRVFGSLFNKLEEEELAAWEIDNECIKLEDPDFSISVFGVADTLF